MVMLCFSSQYLTFITVMKKNPYANCHCISEIYFLLIKSFIMFSERVSDCCLTPSLQYFSDIMAK